MELQKLFKENYVTELYNGVQNGSLLKYYKSDTFLYDNQKIVSSPKITKHGEGKLLLPEGSKHNDFENSKIIFETYKTLTPLQASDIRFWTYLSHVDYYEYMHHRWAKIRNNSESNPTKYILEHWFIKSPSQSNFLRHGIAGLWWAAYLTYDETRTNPFELTEIIWRQFAFATRDFGTLKLARHKEATIGILEYIIENEHLFLNQFEPKSRFILKYLNQIGGIKPLSYLNRNFFKNNLELVRKRIETAKRGEY